VLGTGVTSSELDNRGSVPVRSSSFVFVPIPSHTGSSPMETAKISSDVKRLELEKKSPT
jgi:hypothetical protein